MTTPREHEDVGLFDLDDLDDATWWDLYGDLVDDDTATVQCITCRLATTVAALEGRGHLGHAAHGPHSPTCRRYGKCLACGAVEVVLDRPSGGIALPGDPDPYPTGHGCEVCS